jgi:hypothetical protein
MVSKRRFSAVVISILPLVLFVSAELCLSATTGMLTFAWDTDQSVVDSQGITELRVYQDSSTNEPFVADPMAGTIQVRTDIDGCSNFWATYATATEESDRTDPPIEVCEPKLTDPEPATRVVEVGGFKLTIDFEPVE